MPELQSPEDTSKSTKGFFTRNNVILIVFIIISLAAALFLVIVLVNSNAKEANRQVVQEDRANNNATDDSPPVLKNLGIQFGNYDEMTGRSGAFIFDRDALASNWPVDKIFLEFGSTNVGKVFPEIVYNQVDADTDVTALADGKVVEVRFQAESNDYAFSTVSGESWAINYDHVRDVTFKVGDEVKAGDVIGKVGLNKDGITGFVELAVKKVDQATDETVGYCPLDLLASDIKSTYVAHFTNLMSDWESYMADTTIYDEANMYLAGCSLKTLDY